MRVGALASDITVVLHVRAPRFESVRRVRKLTGKPEAIEFVKVRRLKAVGACGSMAQDFCTVTLLSP